MMYTKPIVVRLLIENTQNYPLKGVLRPQVYIAETGNYSSIIRLNLLDKEINKSEKVVLETILESPIGFGEHLKEGTLLVIKNGLDTIGKAILLEVLRIL